MNVFFQHSHCHFHSGLVHSAIAESAIETGIFNGLGHFASIFNFAKDVFPEECFSAASSENQNEFPPSVRLAFHYSVYMAKHCGIETNKEQESEHAKALNAVLSFLERLRFLTGRKTLQWLVTGESSNEGLGLDVEKMLPKELHGIGHAVKVWNTVSDELKALATSEHDWKNLCEKLSFFETISAALSDPVMADELFDHLRPACQEYVSAYLEACHSPMTQLGVGLMDEINQFLNKFGSISKYAEEW